MTETTFDWAAYVAAPRYFCGDSWERWSPWSYRRPDGSVSLAVGRKAADASILCVSGDGWKVMAMPFLRTDEEKSNPVNVLPLTKPDHAADQA